MAHAGVPRILERVDLQVERKTLWKKKRIEKNIYLALDLDLGHRWETARARQDTNPKDLCKVPGGEGRHTARYSALLRAHNFSRAREITVMGRVICVGFGKWTTAVRRPPVDKEWGNFLRRRKSLAPENKSSRSKHPRGIGVGWSWLGGTPVCLRLIFRSSVKVIFRLCSDRSRIVELDPLDYEPGSRIPGFYFLMWMDIV